MIGGLQSKVYKDNGEARASEKIVCDNINVSYRTVNQI